MDSKQFDKLMKQLKAGENVDITPYLPNQQQGGAGLDFEEPPIQQKPSFLSRLAGGGLRALGAPSAIASTGARAVGGFLGALSGKNLGMAGGELKKGVQDIAAIPGQIKTGFEQGITSTQDELISPSKELKLTGLGGLAVDIAGDPLNILGAQWAKQFGTKIATKKPLLKSIGEQISQILLNPKTSDEAKEFASIGKVFNEITKETASTLGSKFAPYKISGTYSGMIKKMNTEIPKLGKQLNNAVAKIPVETKISIEPIKKELFKLVDNLFKLGDKKTANKVFNRLDEITKGGALTEMPVEEALNLKRIYDDARLLASGRLSEATATGQKILKIVSNSLRKQLNEIPEIGKLNEKMSTFYDAIEALSIKGAQMSKKWPLYFKGKLPYVGVNLKGAVSSQAAKFFTTLAKPIQKARSGAGQFWRTLLPSLPSKKIKE